MRTCVVGLIAALTMVGCGDEERAATPVPSPATAAPETTSTPSAPTATRGASTGTRLVVRESEFGRMLFGPRRRAVYIFERDRPGESRCYGECARAWPPVYTRGKPVARRGVRAALLGTTRRRNGRQQVTYRGQPLYYYAHEGPGEVRCHNVNLNGGFWWVVGPSGRRRP